MRLPIIPNTSFPRFSAFALLLAPTTGLALLVFGSGCGSGGHAIPVPTPMPAGLAAEYAAVDIGTPDGYALDFAAAVNNSGQIVSNWRNSAGQSHGFLYTPGSGFIDVGTLADAGQTDSVYLYAINNRGQVAGNVSSSPTRPFVYSDGKVKDLSGSLSANATILQISDSGEIVGSEYQTVSANPAAPISSAFFRAANGGTQDIGALVPSETNSYELNSYASSVNDSGLVVGYYSLSNNGAYDSRLFEYENGKLITLASLGNQYGSLAKVNSSGQITGTLRDFKSSADAARAFLFTGGAVKDLGTLGGLESVSYGISDGGVVVGYSLVDGSNKAAFAWHNGKMTNLNAITTGLNGVTLSGADAISPNSGIIIANGTDSSGDRHVFVLSPVADINATKETKEKVRSASTCYGKPVK